MSRKKKVTNGNSNKPEKNTAIGPATATFIITDRGDAQFNPTLVPCSRCGRKGRAGDTPTEVDLSDGTTWSICYRFEQPTGALICKQCVSEIS